MTIRGIRLACTGQQEISLLQLYRQLFINDAQDDDYSIPSLIWPPPDRLCSIEAQVALHVINEGISCP